MSDLSSLRQQLETRSKDQLIMSLVTLLIDWADDDTRGRKLALQVLSDFEVNGDSFGVPSLVDIIETLVERIKGVK